MVKPGVIPVVHGGVPVSVSRATVTSRCFPVLKIMHKIATGENRGDTGFDLVSPRFSPIFDISPDLP